MKQAPIPYRRKVAPNSRIANALKELKPRFWDGKGDRPYSKEWAICYGIQLLRLSDKAEFRDYVARTLDDYAFYTGWLSKQPDTDRELMTLSPAYVQAGRIRWIDQMIEDFGGPP